MCFCMLLNVDYFWFEFPDPRVSPFSTSSSSVINFFVVALCTSASASSAPIWIQLEHQLGSRTMHPTTPHNTTDTSRALQRSICVPIYACVLCRIANDAITTTKYHTRRHHCPTILTIQFLSCSFPFSAPCHFVSGATNLDKIYIFVITLHASIMQIYRNDIVRWRLLRLLHFVLSLCFDSFLFFLVASMHAKYRNIKKII